MSPFERIKIILRARKLDRELRDAELKRSLAEKKRLSDEMKSKEDMLKNMSTSPAYEICALWDEVVSELCDLVDSGAIEPKQGDHTTMIGEFKIWTSSWTHAYGHPYGSKYYNEKVICSPSVRMRLHDTLSDNPRGVSAYTVLLEKTRETARKNLILKTDTNVTLLRDFDDLEKSA